MGLFMFTKGFLLMRIVANNASTCHVDFASNSKHSDQCWMHTSYKKAVFIIVDGLRYDFAKYDESLDKNLLLPYQNKLTIFWELLQTQPAGSFLYKFVADPPTTTMQRLKGLTTGSLPTFVDAGANFASSEIVEDNFIDQLLSGGKRTIFLGDDTWMGLFPNRFHKSYPFPSLNVHDLHTVDNGINSKIFHLLKSDNWDVMIAHYLGVDHCGHRYGPNHPEMGSKLTQMNQNIRYYPSVVTVLGYCF